MRCPRRCLFAAAVLTAAVSCAKPSVPEGDGRSDATHRLAAVFAAARDGEEVFLPAGRYLLRGAVAIGNLKNFTLRGEPGTVIVTRANPAGTLNECNAALKIRNCSGFRMENLTFTTDEPTGAAGRIVSTDPAGGTFDVRIDDPFPASGNERVGSLDTCSESGMPDRILSLTGRLKRGTDVRGRPVLSVDGVPYRVVAPRTLRFTAPGASRFPFARLRKGHRVGIRYSLWGGGLVTFSNVRGAVVKNVRVEQCIAMAVVIGPRSRDMVFEGFSIAPDEGSPAVFSSNADGIHVTGMSGYLKLRNCRFQGLGDDALNVHSRAGIVGGTGSGRTEIFCSSRAYDGGEMPLPPSWAEAGDVLAVYDPATFRRKGEVRLVRFAGGRGELEPHGVDIKTGDVVANTAFYPAVEITDSHCRAMRARGFLLQTGDVAVRRCRFEDIALPALLFAPDIERWFEMGPSSNVEIENCVFRGCASMSGKHDLAAVAFAAGHHGREGGYPPGVHRNVRFSKNRFEAGPGAAVSLSAVDGVEFSGNVFSGFEAGSPPVVLRRCANVCADFPLRQKGCK